MHYGELQKLLHKYLGTSKVLKMHIYIFRVKLNFNFFSHISATKMMFWALARVSFRAAKIVSCNKKKKNSWSTIKITAIVLLYFPGNSGKTTLSRTGLSLFGKSFITTVIGCEAAKFFNLCTKVISLSSFSYRENFLLAGPTRQEITGAALQQFH
jgi:hypothetical protein